MQLDLLDGEMTDQCGQDHRPANRSQSQESRKGQTMSDISGPSGSISSESADLQSYLESKLAPLSGMAGLIPFKKTWKLKATPAQRRYCQLQVSALSTKGIGSGSWPTPAARDGKDGAAPSVVNSGRSDKMAHCVHLMEDVAKWPTPMHTDGSKACNRYRENYQNGLGAMASTISAWPTASARDHKGGYPGGRIRNGQWSVDTLDVTAQLMGWPTPCASDNRNRGHYDSGAVQNRIKKGKSIELSMLASSIWLTPTTSDTNGTRELDGKRSGGLNTQATTLWPTVTTQDNAQMAGQYSKTNGTTLGGAVRQCNAKTEKSAPSQLNPRFSLWLMGYPIEWAYCAERVTPLSRKSRRKS